MPTHIASKTKPKPEPHNADSFTTRLMGKVRSFGTPRTREGRTFEHFRRAYEAANALPSIRDALAEDDTLTEKGQLLMLRETTRDFFDARAAAMEHISRRADDIRAQREKARAFDWDANSPAHARLIEQYNKLVAERGGMDAIDKVRTSLPRLLDEFPELGKALLNESRLVTGLSEADLDTIRDAITPPEAREKLAELDEEEADLAAAAKAYDTATECIAEACQYSEQDLAKLAEEAAPKVPAEPENEPAIYELDPATAAILASLEGDATNA